MSTIDDVGIFAISTGFAIGAEGHYVERVSAALAWSAICERASPRIVDTICIVDVWTIPAGNAGGPEIQCRQPLLGGGIATDIEPVQVENTSEPFDRLIGDSVFCRTELPHHCRSNQANKKPEYRQDHKQLDESETVFLVMTR